MTDFTRLKLALNVRLKGRATEVRVKRGNELHCRIVRADAPALAELLRSDFNAELILMVANDRRADKGVFEVHYLFTKTGRTGFCMRPKKSRPHVWRSPR